MNAVANEKVAINLRYQLFLDKSLIKKVFSLVREQHKKGRRPYLQAS